MPQHFADRLIEAAIAKKTPAVVALDPVLDRLPGVIVSRVRGAGESDIESAADAIWEFGWRVLRAIAPLVAAVKINSAYFERYHAKGIEMYDLLVAEAIQRGLLVIGDVKRGDVGHTAEMYAQAHLAEPEQMEDEPRCSPDAVTVNGYFGVDGVRPFVETAKREGKGVFVLVRTSNESAGAIQDIATADGRKMHEVVAAEVARWAADASTIGARGYSCVGAVVATRDAADAARLRALMPRSIFLAPGYGAQGGRAEDFRPYFKADGTGAVVVGGRSVIYAAGQGGDEADWEAAVRRACGDFVADLARVVQITAAS